MKAIARAYATKRECSVQEAVYLVMPELWLRKIFPIVIFLNSNMPKKRCKIFRKKDETDELSDDSTDIFQRIMLDRYIDRSNEHFKNGQYRQIDQLCFAEFLSLYYILPKTAQISENDCQPVVLNDELMELNHDESRYPDKIELMALNNEKLKCRKVRAVLRYHQPSPQKKIEQYVHHLLFTFYPFRDEAYLKSPPMTGTYFVKLQEPGVMDIINRNKTIMEPFGEIVDQALSNLRSDVTNPDSFSQHENDEVQAEVAAVINDMLEDESFTADAVLLDDSSLNIPSYTAPVLIPDNEISSKIRSLNRKQRELFDMLQTWAKKSIKIILMSDAQPLEPLHIFLTGNAGCGKSFLMKVLHQSLTKILSYGNVSLDKPKVLFMAPTGVAAINIDGTTIHNALNIPINQFGKKISPLSDKMRSSLRSKLSDLKVSITDEISMASNDLLFHVHLRLTEIFGSVNDQPFAGVSVITVDDFFQLPPVGGKPVYANYKDNWQNFNSLWKLFKIFELTEVTRQRGDSQLIDLLNNVRTGDIQPDNINMLKPRVIQPGAEDYP